LIWPAFVATAMSAMVELQEIAFAPTAPETVGTGIGARSEGAWRAVRRIHECILEYHALPREAIDVRRMDDVIDRRAPG
jgi:hypothetical protein